MPAATKEPAMVVMPEQSARQASMRWNAEAVPTSRSMIRPTMAAAPPPKPCRKATSWGIWIIFTLLDRNRPNAVPKAIATQRAGELSELSLYMVTRMAKAMDTAHSLLPRTAVLTLLIRCRP